MKPKILGGIALLSISAIIAFNVSLNLKKTDHSSLLALANVEALASENSYPDYSQCPILEYNRGYMEAYKTKEWAGTVGASGHVIIGGYTFGPFAANFYMRFTYEQGFCQHAPNNCCIKSHVGSAKP
jgi:hypothetical protein